MVKMAALADGRQVSYAEYGDPSGRVALIHLHGAGSCRLEAEVFDGPAAARGVRVIAPDRPGVGASELPMASVTGYARDLAGLADQLDIATFVVSGLSNGGMFAMATAAVLGERVAGVVPINSTTPVAERDARRALPLSARVAYFLMRWAPGPMARAAGRANRPGRAPSRWGGPDSALLAEPRVGELLERIHAVQQHPGYLRAELVAGVGEWGFDHRAVTRPVVFFTGAQDLGRRYAERWVAALPEAQLRVLPGGHVGLFAPDWAEQIVATAAALSKPSRAVSVTT